MSTARKLVLLALTVVAVMAVNASAASAVEVIEEAPMGPNGGHCSTTITEEQASMCNITATSVGHAELGGPFGIMISCNVTLSGIVSESGRVVVNSYDLIETTCENGTLLHECVSATAGHRHPSAEPTSDPVDFPIPIEARFCFDVESPFSLGEIECHLPGTITRVGAAPSHQYQLTFSHTNPCEGGTGFSLDEFFRTPIESGIEILP